MQCLVRVTNLRNEKTDELAKTGAKKNKTIKDRRKTIFYLILNFLKDESLFSTVDSLVSEAKLDDQHQICDNIDLDIILQEYCSFYQLKFSKQPCILKKSENTSNAGAVRTSRSAAGRKYQHRRSRRASNDSNIAKAKVESDDLALAVGVVQMKPLARNYSIDGDDKCGEVENSFISKPLSGFQLNKDSEQRDIAEKIAREVICKTKEVTWNQIVGLQDAKNLLMEAVVYPRKYPALFDGMAPWKGILLHGPPGTGKTMLAKAVAGESGTTFFNITPTTILSKWRGDSEKNIKTLFALARYYAPSIIFIDELEAIASNRDNPGEHEASRRLKCQLLIELDGVVRNDDIFLLAASNLPWEIDPAILRRLEKRIHIPPPSEEMRTGLFRIYCRRDGLDTTAVDYERAARRTEGYSGSDIRVICKEAMMMSVRRIIHGLSLNSSKPLKRATKMTQDDIDQSITRTKSSVENLTKKYLEWDQKLGAK